MLEYTWNEKHYKMGIDYLLSLGYVDSDIYISNARTVYSDVERKHKRFIRFYDKKSDEIISYISFENEIITNMLVKNNVVLDSYIQKQYLDIDCKYNIYHFAGEPDLRTLSDGKYWEVKKFYNKENEIIFEKEQVAFLMENLDSNIIIFSNDCKFADVLQSKELLSKNCDYKIKVEIKYINGFGMDLVKKVLSKKRKTVDIEVYNNRIHLHNKEFKNIKVLTKIFNVNQNKWSFLLKDKQYFNTYFCIGLSLDRKNVEHVWIITNTNETNTLNNLIVYNEQDSLLEYCKYETDVKPYNNIKKDKTDYKELIKKEKRKLYYRIKKEKQEENNEKQEENKRKKQVILNELGRLETTRFSKLAFEIDLCKYKGITKEPKKLDEEQFKLDNFI